LEISGVTTSKKNYIFRKGLYYYS